MPDLYSELVSKVARDGARVHQLRFARERLEKVQTEIRSNIAQIEPRGRYHAAQWLTDVEYAIAQIKAAEHQ